MVFPLFPQGRLDGIPLMRYTAFMTDPSKTSVHLSPDLKARMQALGLKPARAIELGVGVAEQDSRETLEAMLRRVVREELRDAGMLPRG